MFEMLSGVSRIDDFEADLAFGDAEAAQRLKAALTSTAVPTSMRKAMKRLQVDESTVRLKFRQVDEVELTVRGPGHVAACVLDDLRPGASE